MRVIKTSVTGIIAFFFFFSCIYSQTNYAYPATEKYRFRHLTADDGFPVNMCYSVLKDTQGFIWITTRSGLCRYDGYKMKVYQYDPLDSTSISDNSISGTQSMVIDHSGNLWISTYESLNRFDAVSETFKRYKPDPKKLGSIKGNVINCVYLEIKINLFLIPCVPAIRILKT